MNTRNTLLGVMSSMLLLSTAGSGIATGKTPIIRATPIVPARVDQRMKRIAMINCKRVAPCTHDEYIRRLNSRRWHWFWGKWEIGAPSGVASYYTLYGNKTADGTIMAYGNRSIASKTYPLGTVCRLYLNGNKTWGIVHDRGPFVSGRDFDLEKSLADTLGYSGVARIKYRCDRK